MKGVFKDRALDRVKEKFLALYPREENVREQRFKLAGFKCENCESNKLLEHHHICGGDLRRDFFERVFTTRIVCEACHKVERKGEMIRRFRIELTEVLQPDFTDAEIRTILGTTKNWS
jgi:hypothetical protein